MKNSNLKGGLNFDGKRKSRPLFLSKSVGDTRSEYNHQCAFYSWLKLNERQNPVLKRFFHIPNGEYRDKVEYTRRNGSTGFYSPTGKKLQAAGLKPGVLDNLLPVGRNGFIGLWIEFKSEHGELTDAQKEWVEFLKSENHSVHVVKLWGLAAQITVEYLNLTDFTPYVL